MKKLIFAIILSPIISGCCKIVACGDPGPNTLNFRLLSKADSTNLLFCSTKKYSYSNIGFTTIGYIKPDTLQKYIYEDFATEKIDCDTLVGLYLNENNTRIFIHLTSSVVDTIDVVYENTGSKCCGYYSHVSTARYNRKQIYPDSNNIYNFYK